MAEGYPTPPPERGPMSDDELIAMVQLELADALGNYGDQYLESRRTALNQYFGNLRGDEQEGQSSVVSRVVFEEVEWALPALMEIFTSGQEVVEFNPQGPEDEEEAEQRTELSNWVVLRQNNGFLVLYTMFKDALIQKTGVVKVYWDESEEATFEEYEGKTMLELVALSQDPELEIVEATPREAEVPTPVQDPMTGEQTMVMQMAEVFDVKARRTNEIGQCRIENVPPEEFLISRHARSIEEARFVAHRRVDITESELVAMGYDADLVRSLPSSGSDVWTDTDMIIRSSQEDTNVFYGGLRTDAERTLTYTEAYVNLDFDGDGISELRKVCLVGDGSFTLLANEPVDVKPFASVTPCPIPHRYYGLSLADMVTDLEDVDTTVMRQYLQALYLANNPRQVVLSQGDAGAPMANLDQLLNPVPGGYVEEYAPGAIRPLITGDAAATALPALDKIRDMREARTGISRFDQGVDADQIHRTATGVNRIMAGRAQRLALIARVFADTGVRDLFRLVDGCLRKNQTAEMTYRLRGEWITANPADWKTRMDATVSVGLGHGSRAEKAEGLMMMGEYQKQAIERGASFVTEENLYQTAKELTQAVGFPNPDKFWTDPSTMPPQEPEPDPAVLAIEAQQELEAQKLDLEREKLILERTVEEFKHERGILEIRLKYEASAAEAPMNDPGFSLGRNGGTA